MNMTMESTIGEYQHGFRKGKDAITAWKQILLKIKEGKFIYEFDLNACFNRISAKTSLRILETRGLDSSLILYLRARLSSAPIVDPK